MSLNAVQTSERRCSPWKFLVTFYRRFAWLPDSRWGSHKEIAIQIEVDNFYNSKSFRCARRLDELIGSRDLARDTIFILLEKVDLLYSMDRIPFIYY